MSKPFAPNWASKPGNTIWDIINALHTNVSEMGRLIGLSPEDAQKLIDAEIPITVDIAERLAINFGPSVQFWLNRQAQYEESLARINSTHV